MPDSKLEYPVERRLRDKSHFQHVYASGKRQHTPFFQIITAPALKEIGKIAIACPKKVGKAHDRNRCKRRIKEAVRLNLAQFPTHRDIIFLAKHTARSAPFDQIAAAIKSIIETKKE